MVTLEDQLAPRRRDVSLDGLGGNHLLERVALALNSTLELWEVLKTLAGITLEATGADRCSVFLLDGCLLRPTAAIGRRRDEDLWAQFNSMGPVDIAEIPSGWDRLLEGCAVAIPNAAESDMIPPEWVERFSLRSVVLVPLLVAGDPCGVMGVDYQEPHTFTDDELRLLEAIGSYAAVAVRNARLFEATRRRSELQEGLARAAAALVSPLERGKLARKLVNSYTDLFGARLCAIGLVDENHTRIDVVAARGTNGLPDSIATSDVPKSIIESLRAQWGARELLEFSDDPWLAETIGGRTAGATRYVLLPLTSQKHLRGGILLGFADTLLDPQEMSAATGLAAIASAALERSILLDELARQLRHVEALHALGGALAEKADARALVTRLNNLLSGEGIDVVGLVFRDRVLARRLGGDESSPIERAAWQARKGCVVLDDGSLSVPMRLGRRLVGALRVKPSDLSDDELAFVEALAHGVAEVANRGALRAVVEEAERERAVAAERGRIASDLHDTAGQLFVAIGLLARRQAQHLPPDSPWAPRFLRLAELADKGKWEIDRAVQALAFFPAARRGLPSALRSLARSFESDSGIQVLVEVGGSYVRLAPRVEQGLYRVAHEALMNAWRHARCSVIRVLLDFSDGEVVLTITDDGVGIEAALGDEGRRVGIVGMRRAVEELGGKVRVHAGKPRGTIVEARVRKEYR